jgi:hypothetical protein
MNRHLSARLSTVMRALVCCALLFGTTRAWVQAQVRPPELKQQQDTPRRQQAAKNDADDDDKDDDKDDEDAAERGAVFGHPPVADPAALLRKARFVYVHSDSAFISGSEVEDSLRKRKEFQAWGMIVTRSEAQADLIIEITRKPFTRRFTFTVLDPTTREVLTSGKTRSVIFGKKIANKVAEKFANRVKVYRPYPSSQ